MMREKVTPVKKTVKTGYCKYLQVKKKSKNEKLQEKVIVQLLLEKQKRPIKLCTFGYV